MGNTSFDAELSLVSANIALVSLSQKLGDFALINRQILRCLYTTLFVGLGAFSTLAVISALLLVVISFRKLCMLIVTGSDIGMNTRNRSLF